MSAELSVRYRDLQLAGSIQAIDDGFELEIFWRFALPNHSGCAHPAITELARMLLKDIDLWMGPCRNLTHTIDRLAADERATDYDPRPGTQLQITPEFHRKLLDYAMCLHAWVIRDGEVLPSEEVRTPRLRLVTIS